MNRSWTTGALRTAVISGSVALLFVVSGNAQRSGESDAPIDRLIWSDTVPESSANISVSADGRFLAYSSDDTGELVLRDLQTQGERKLTASTGEAAGDWIYRSAMSRDGRSIAYNVMTGPAGKRRNQLRILELSAKPGDKARLLVDRDAASTVSPYEWSRDGKQLAVQWFDDKGAHVGVMGVQDGSLQTVKTLGRRGTTRLALSPDGKFLAFDDLVIDGTDARRISIASTAAASEVALPDPGRNRIVGWSADSKTLLFLSNRAGDVGLWAQSLIEGRLAGRPVLLKSSLDGSPIGTTDSGAVVYYAATVRRNIQIATVDLESGSLLSPPRTIPRVGQGSATGPRWSADGKSFAHIWYSPATATARNLVIQSPEGRRVLSLTVEPRDSLDWSRDGLEFAARALATDGRQGIYRINAATGAPTLVVADGGGVTRAYPEFSSDKTKIYYLRVARTAGSTSPVEWYVERDLATGQERELFQPPQSQLRFAGRSPDGGFVVAFTIVPESALMVIDTTTGLGRELRRVPRGNAFSTHGGVRWTPDSKALLVIESIQGRNELRRVPLEGKPHPLSIGVTNLAEEMIDVHPDGRQIAFLAGEPNLTEIRVLERVLKPNGSRYP